MVGGNNFDSVRPKIEGKSSGSKPNRAQTKDDVLLEWDGMSFDKKDKGLKWYLLAVLFILVLIGVLIWQRDWYAIGITVVVSAVFFWYLNAHEPEQRHFSITPLGIMVDDRLYPFSEIHSYWVVYNQSVKKLYIAFTRKYLPPLNISLENIDPVVLKSILGRRIPEQTKRGENLLDQIIRIIGV